ncbi:MAG: hypothetical protein HGB00_01890 [Chlorobiaceae bacterium]|nr:hypothetical protein [Chlorobiaceae bacterium]
MMTLIKQHYLGVVLMHSKRNVFLFAVIALGLVVYAIGYIPRYPIWVDDFSCIGDDVFSRIIVNGRYDQPNPSLGRGTGFSMLDSAKINRMSDSVFVGQHRDVVMQTFNVYGCGCDVVKGKDGEEHLICKFKRQWKLKNIGMRSSADITDLSIIPITVIRYDFKADNDGIIRHMNVQLINMTQYKISSQYQSIIK